MTLSSSNSPLEYTALEHIPLKVNHLRSGFEAGKLADVKSRLHYLRNFYFAIKDAEPLLKKAVAKDLSKPEGEFQLQELNTFYSDILNISKNLENWAKPSYPDVSFLFKFSGTKIIPSPLGTICVISASNYPFIIAVQPLVAALCAGNTCLVKMSEVVPNISAVLTEILEDVFEEDIVSVVNGGIAETSMLLDQKFDKILFTGSTQVGKIVAMKAAQNLTPVVLELGGKNPCFVTEGNEQNLSVAAKRIAFGKFVNAGQVCVTADYCVVHESVYDEFVDNVVAQTKKLYGSLSPDEYNKIINVKGVKRLQELVENSKGEIVYQQGEIDEEKRYFPLTILKDVPWDDPLMKDEIFGPIMPIIKYSDLDMTIKRVKSVHDSPLSLIIFTRSKSIENKIISEIKSGGVSVNEIMIHVGCGGLPFGGVGKSGYGVYHGKFSFDTCSHPRAYLNQPYWLEKYFKSKYDSIKNPVDAFTNWIMLPSLPFSRTGKITTGGIKSVLSLHVISFAFMGLIASFFTVSVEQLTRMVAFIDLTVVLGILALLWVR